MKTSFNEKLINLLKKDTRFVDDAGELLKNAVVSQASNYDKNLVKLLILNSEIKKKFFEEIEGYWIFKINSFIDYISDKNFLANSYTRFRNKIGLNIDGKFLRERGEVSLVWPYKDCVLEGGQTKEEEKRKEIFFNEILAQDEIDRLFDPKVLTNWKRYTVDGEQEVTEIKRDDNGTIRENLIIKGNNLMALHSLKKQFRGKVKLIYIDIPYFFSENKEGDTFQYNSNFKLSTWLTFHKDRIKYAKDMLSKSGVIFIHSNDDSQAYLKVVCDNIFSISNYVNTIAVNLKNIAGASGGGEDKKFKKNIEYIHIYAKNYETLPTFNNL
ncbi:MAG: site-specific DNA-methyltransferase [Psychroflexus sp.]